MSTPTLVSGARMLRTADWLFDRELEAQDRAMLIEYDRREAIEKTVSFDDLLEECCIHFTGPQREAFMKALASGGNDDVHLLYCLLDQMKEAVIKRRLAQGD